jgi:hypothetical protein
MASPRSALRRTLMVAIPALFLALAGLTMLVDGLSDLASGSTIIRASGKPTVVAKAVGQLASEFGSHVWSAVVVGAVFIVVGAALLSVLRFGSDAAREKLLAFDESRSRSGRGRSPSWFAQVAAVIAVIAIMFWLTAG